METDNQPKCHHPVCAPGPWVGSCRIKPQQRGYQRRHSLVFHLHWPREDVRTQVHPEKGRGPDANPSGTQASSSHTTLHFHSYGSMGSSEKSISTGLN